MQQFEDQTELEEWLDDLDYEGFWKATDPHGLDAEYKANCDASIAEGVDKEMILGCIKARKRLEIISDQNLRVRITKKRPMLH